jgi:hypothetical protein
LSASIVTVYGTGLDNAGNLLPDNAVDPHYSLILYPGQIGSAPAPSYALSGITFSYNTSGTTSRWISWSPTWIDATPNGTWIYRTTFDLTGFIPSTTVLTGRLLSDDDGTLFLNGVNTGVHNHDNFNWTNFNITNGFVPGVNTVDFQVLNANFVSFNPSALRVDLSATAVPEPSAIVLSAVASGWIAFRRWRKRA